jgi:hypothetical protein
MSSVAWLVAYAMLGVSFIRSEPAPVRVPERGVRILAPLTKGAVRDVPAPTDDQIVKALGLPAMPVRRIRFEKIAEYVDPPRVYPLIGPAQLCHERYDCTIEGGTGTKHVTVDQNHFHMLGE